MATLSDLQRNMYLTAVDELRKLNKAILKKNSKISSLKTLLANSEKISEGLRLKLVEVNYQGDLVDDG